MDNYLLSDITRHALSHDRRLLKCTNSLYNPLPEELLPLIPSPLTLHTHVEVLRSHLPSILYPFLHFPLILFELNSHYLTILLSRLSPSYNIYIPQKNKHTTLTY